MFCCRRRPVDYPFRAFEYLFFLLKTETDIKDVISLQICNTRTITSEKQISHKIINFCIGPLKVLRGSQTLGPLEDLQETFPGRRVPAGCFLSQFSRLKCIQWNLPKADTFLRWTKKFVPDEFRRNPL